MMKNSNGVSSQPRLLSRHNDSTYNLKKDSNPYLLSEKISQFKYIPVASGRYNKQNELGSNNRHNSSYSILDDNQKLSKPKTTTLGSPKPTGSSYTSKFFPKEREENNFNGQNINTHLVRTGGIRSGAVEYKKKNCIKQHELKRTEYNQMQEKVKEIQHKIQKIKQAMDKTENSRHEDMSSSQQQSQLNKCVTRAQKNSYVSKKQADNDKTAQTTIMENLVTQVPAPSHLIQCSSQTNLTTAKLLLKPAAAHKYYISTVVSAYFQKANTSFTQLCKNHLYTSLQLLKNTRHIQKPRELPAFKALPKTHKNTIVFDLDETLIHCNENVDMPHDVVLNITFPNGQGTKAGINVRPWAQECLKELAEHFELIVFTASHECYGNVVVDYLDPKKEYISYRYFRDSCYRTPEGYYVKDLRVIDRPLDKMLLVDNAAYSYAFQVQNGIPVIPFYDCKTDIQLKHLIQYLKPMTYSSNLRNEHCKSLKTNEYPKFSDPVQLINKLYGEYLAK